MRRVTSTLTHGSMPSAFTKPITMRLLCLNLSTASQATLADNKPILHIRYCVGYQGLILPEECNIPQGHRPSGILQSLGSNKSDIQHSKSAIFVLLYSLHLHDYTYRLIIQTW